MEKNKNKNKKRTLTISTSFNKTKVSETCFRKPEKKAFFPDKKKSSKPISKNRNFFNHCTYPILHFTSYHSTSYRSTVHQFHLCQPKIFQIRNRHTINIASIIMALDIFDSPTVRSMKMMGISPMENPFCQARKFISI